MVIVAVEKKTLSYRYGNLIAIVAGSKEGGNEVKEKLILAGITGPFLENIAVSETGFSDFVRREADEFLSSKD